MNKNDTLLEISNTSLFYGTMNEEVHQRIWIFIICKKSIQQLMNAAARTRLDAVKNA